jgi:DNA-binding SARP family transcriptional activator
VAEPRVQAGEPRQGGAAAPLLRLFLLGRFEVVREDAPVPPHAWRRRRPADLLKLVALAPGRTLTREQTIDALWPSKDPASGANNLHRALYDLRQILGGRWVDIERGQLALRPDVWVDVDAFERAAAQDTAEARADAIALYRGDLAPEDVDAPWLDARRAELRARFLTVGYPLAHAAAEAGDAAAAVPLLRRLLDADPTAEQGHRLLMRLLALTGRRAEALRAYDGCEGALRAAGGGPPSEETRALRLAIQRGELGPPQDRPALDGARRAGRRLLGTADPPPVRGRGPILLLLEALVERGHGMLVLLGEQGVGKTRLAIEGARFAQGRGAAVLSASAAAHPGSPHGLLLDLVNQDGRVDLSTPLGDRAGAVEAVQRALHDTVEAQLTALAEGRPLFLLLDDLHLADGSSLNLVHHLALRAGTLRLMMVATCRDEAIHAGTPIQTALAHLDGARLARGVRLPRLNLAGTRDQMADLLGQAPAEPLLAQVYRVTDGCPFLVEEACRAQQEAGQVPSDPAAALRARATRLGPRPEALLAAAAVAGRRFDFDWVRPASGLTGQEAVKALEACLDARLLDDDGAGYHFRHDLVREALYDGLPAARRAALHAAVADAMEADPARPPPPELLAHHRRLAGQQERALRHLTAAGHRAAERAALSEALGFYGDALDLAGRTGAAVAVRRELLDASARAQLLLGELAGSARTFELAARLPGDDGAPAAPEARARAHRLAALAHAAAGALSEAFGQIQEGLGAAGEDLAERASLLHLAAQLHWHEGRAGDALAAAQACAAAARQAGDADLLARAHDLAAITRGLTGEPLPPLDDETRPGDRRRQDVAPEHPVNVHLALWDHDLLGDRSCAELHRAAGLIVERARLREAPDSVAAGRYGEGTVALAAGHLEAAELALQGARAAFAAQGIALGEALCLERLGTLLTLSGRTAEAAALLSQGVVVAERAGLRRHALTRLHAAEIRNRLAAGLVGAADDAAREASESAARHGECVACDAAFRPEAVRVHLASGRADDAEAEVAALEDIARERKRRGLAAVARLARARVLAARGRVDEALVALAQARAGFLAGGLRYQAARAVRLEARLRGSLPDAWRELDALIRVDGDA